MVRFALARAGFLSLMILLLVVCFTASEPQHSDASNEMRLIILDPGHFHAALLQKEMLPGVSRSVYVYAPLGPDLTAHLNRIAQFNGRKENPTHWEMEIYAGPNFLERMLEQHRGNVVVFSGRNRDKIDQIQSSIAAGFQILADKPWIIKSIDLQKLQAALNAAEERGSVAFDIMTERFEVTNVLQRELVNDTATFGTVEPGTEQEPGVSMESMHYLMKSVAGAPLIRPAWFFDIGQQGEGLADIGTHLTDLVQWSLFPDQAIDYLHDVQIIAAKHWPTLLNKTEFQRVTGENNFPAFLSSAVKGDRLEYYCNNQLSYSLRGIHVRLDVVWNYEAPPGGGDTYRSVFRGSRSRVEVRQGPDQNYKPEIYVVPDGKSVKGEVLAALKKRVATIQNKFPGLSVEDRGSEYMLNIPEQYRIGHEAHFKQVVGEFLRFLKDPRTLPSWEKPNMLAKYYVTTKGVELARRSSAGNKVQ